MGQGKIDAWDINRERFLETKIEVKGRIQACLGGLGLRRSGSDVPSCRSVGQEKTILFDGLGRSGAAIALWPIRGEGNQGKSLIVGFDDRREKLGCGSARGGEHCHGAASSEDATQGEEGGGSLLKEIPQADAWTVQQSGNDGSVTSTSGDADFPNPEICQQAQGGLDEARL